MKIGLGIVSLHGVVMRILSDQYTRGILCYSSSKRAYDNHCSAMMDSCREKQPLSLKVPHWLVQNQDAKAEAVKISKDLSHVLEIKGKASKMYYPPTVCHALTTWFLM